MSDLYTVMWWDRADIQHIIGTGLPWEDANDWVNLLEEREDARNILVLHSDGRVRHSIRKNPSRPCPDCAGTGRDTDGAWCLRCDGGGAVGI